MKRPMVWFGLAFVFGEILGFMSLWLLGIGISMAIVLCVWAGNKKMRHIRDRVCFFLLPVFCSLGGSCLFSARQNEYRLVNAVDDLPSFFVGMVIESKTYKNKQVICVQTQTYKIKCSISLDEATSLPELLDYVEICGKVTVFDRASNPGCYDAYVVHRQENLFYQISSANVTKILKKGPKWIRLLQVLRQRMNRVLYTALPEATAGVLSAMVTGDKSEVSEGINNLFQSQGIAHIMAISGLHITMAGFGVYKLLKLGYVPMPFRQMLSLLIVLLYICMCGFSVSSIRAVIMFTAILGSEIIGRQNDQATSLAIAALAVLIRTPYALFSFSFLMSFGCMISILVMIRMKGKMAGVYITLATMPILAWFQYEVPAYSILTNMFVVPAMSVLFPLGLVGSLLGCLYLPVGKILCLGSGVILKFYMILCHITEKLPLSVIITGRPSLVKCILVYCALLVFFILSACCGRKEKSDTSAVINGRISILNNAVRFRYWLLAVYLVLFMHSAPNQLEVLFLDVGQGDCSIIRATDGTVFMIDGGSTSESDIGRYTISKVLKYYGIDVIDFMMLSHMDADHVNGAHWLIENGWHIGQIVISEVTCNKATKEELLDIARHSHIPVYTVRSGDCMERGELLIRCLHPDENFKTDSDNAASAVLEMLYGNCRILFTGDVEGEGEKQLTQIMKTMNMEVKEYEMTILKVAHHGSKYSTSETFLQLVQPDYAVISCGRNNIYGHPHSELLKRLAAIDCQTMITAYAGAVLVECNGVQMDVYCMSGR